MPFFRAHNIKKIMFSIIDSIVAQAMSWVTILMSWDTGTIIVSILGVWFLIIVIGLIYAIVTAVKKFQSWSKKR